MKGIIDDVIIDPSKIQPIIVNFQNGALKDEEAAKMKCGLYYDSDQKKTIVALSNGQIVYKGYRPDTSSDLMQTMLVVHNKRTGKIRLLQAERWQVSPVLHNSTVDNETNNGIDKIAELNKQFGSKKAKRKTEQTERMRINVEVVKEQLEDTAANVQIQDSDFSSITMESTMEESGIPKCNREATDLNDVYNIEDIIPKDKLECLYDPAKEILQKPIQGQSKFFEVTLNRLKSNPDNVKKVAILIYMDAACKWLCTPIKQGKKQGIDICPVSHEVNSHILKSYSIPSIHGRTRPNSIRDKGLVHCIILALMISKFSLDLELFSTLLKTRVGLKKLTELARVIGALPSKDDKKIVTLKLPLPPPLPMVKRGRKK